MKFRNPLTWQGWLFAIALLTATTLITLSITACAALSLESKATALYGTFVVAEKTGAALIQSAEVSDHLKLQIQHADAEAKPVADALLTALLEFQAEGGAQAREQLQRSLESATEPIGALALAGAPRR